MKIYCLALTGLPPLLMTVGRNGSADGGSSRLAFSILVAVAVVLIAAVNRRKQTGAAASRKPGHAPFSRPAARPGKQASVSAPNIQSDKEKELEEELKGLLEAGLISREEYRERLASLRGR